MFALGVRISKVVEAGFTRQPAFGFKINKKRGTEITEPKYEKRFHKVWLTCVHTVSHTVHCASFTFHCTPTNQTSVSNKTKEVESRASPVTAMTGHTI